MKIQNEPAAYGLLAGLIAFLLCMILVGGCVHEARGRDAEVALESSVRISILCADAGGGYLSFGSGVVVNDHTILTAAHVAVDPPGKTCLRTAMMINGGTYLLAPGKALPARDLASLVPALHPFAPTYPVVYGPPPVYGSRVCAMTAYPQFVWRCGETQLTAEPPGDLAHTIIVEGGNSGAGVYDTWGRLVGIVTHRWACSNGQLCGGKLATLEGYVSELMP